MILDEKTQRNISIKEDKLKPLIPSLRTKKRIIRVKILSEKKFDFKTLSENLTHQITLFIGAINIGKAGFWIIKERFDYENQEVLIKTSINKKNEIVGALLLITHINKSPVRIKVEKVSGTIKGSLK